MSAHYTAFAWAPAVRVECLRCGAWFLSREASPRCPVCGFSESED